MRKRLAVLIAVAMLVTSMPFYVFADDEAGTDVSGQAVTAAGEVTGGEEAGGSAPSENVNEGEEGSGTGDATVPDTGDGDQGTVNDGNQNTGDGENQDTGGSTEPGTGNGDGPGTGDGEEPAEVHEPGWNEDHTAYYDENGVALASTVRKIEGVFCYFNADGLYDTSNGWKTDANGNKVYYIRNGKLLVKIITKIDSKRYFFDSKAKVNMTDGWKTATNGKCYVKKGKIVTAPTRIKGTKTVTKYYNKKTGKWQTKKISGAKTKRVKVTTNYLYMFRKDGHLKTTKKLFKYNGKEYYGLGGGRLHTGWRAIVQKKKGYAVYFYKSSGAMAKNTKIKHLKIPKNGRLGRAYYLGIKRLDKTGWSLKSAFWWSVRMRYQGRWYRAKDSETYAIKGFTKGYGNCYCMAATFYVMAKLLGYDVHQVEGRVDLPHSWTVIKQDGKEWVYDPNFTNETGRNGWKIYYGKKGTWRYNHYHKMN